MLNFYPTPLFQTWVKNVYSLCVVRGDICGYSYTGTNLPTQQTIKVVVQPQTYTHLTTSFAPSLYTAFFSHLHLLITHLYTLSTGPIIKTKELKRRKNT